MNGGLFLTFEGLDGCGKTTQTRLLADWLRARGIEPVVTRQPGGTPLGDKLRSVLLDSREGHTLGVMTELALMFADRAQCIEQVIGPALDEGRVVVCDRFTDSTEAYQGGGRKLGSGIVLELHRLLCGGLQPDVTFLIRPSRETSLRRARRRIERSRGEGAREGRFEQEETAFFERVEAGYEMIAIREPQRVTMLDGDETIQQIHSRIVDVVEARLRERAAI